MGDSITHWSGDYSDRYAKLHPEISYAKVATGGARIGQPSDRGTTANTLWGQVDQVLALNPKIVTVFIGANGLLQWFDTTDDTTAWQANVFAYTDLLRSNGIKVLIGTVLPRCPTTYTVASQESLFEARRTTANKALKDSVGKHVDGFFDFGADPTMGLRTAACDPSLYIDGLHPTDGTRSIDHVPPGQGILETVYAPVVQAEIDKLP